MTSEEFNKLPLDARQYIERQQASVCCGKANNLDAHYQNYLIMKNDKLFSLRTGAVSFKDSKGKGAVLYPIHPNDTEEQVKVKLAQAVQVYAVAPEKFDNFSEDKIDKILSGEVDKPKKDSTKSAPNQDGPRDKNGKLLTGAPLKNFLKAESDKAEKAKTDPVIKPEEKEEAKKESDEKPDEDTDEDPLNQ